MPASEWAKRTPRKRRREPVVVRPTLRPDQVKALRGFVRYAIGEGCLTWWEVNFLNHMNQSLYRPTVSPSEKEQAKVQQIKDKLHYDRRDVPLPPLDPDGIVENNDPDGWPIARPAANLFEDAEVLDWTEA